MSNLESPDSQSKTKEKHEEKLDDEQAEQLTIKETGISGREETFLKHC